MSFDLGDLNPVRILAGKGSIGQSGLGSALATIALDAAFPGLSALETAAIVGGGSAIASGSIQKGLMAGIGAYGTQGLVEGLGNIGTDVAGQSLMDSTAEGLKNAGLTPGTDAYNQAFQQASQNFASQLQNTSPLSKAYSGLQNIGNLPSGVSPIDAMGGLGSVAKSGLAALSPVLAAGVNTNTPMPSTTSPTAMIRPYRYSMGRYTALNPVQADKFQGFASGGIAHFDDGGTASDPVAAAIAAGTAGFAPGTTAQDVVNQYGLNADQAQQVAQNLGYTGDLSGLNYGTPAAAASPSISASFFQPGGQGAQIAAQEAANVGAGAPAGVSAAAPQYTQYSPTQMANYIQTSGLDTSDPAALAAAIAQAHADPAAVQKFLASGADPYSAQSLANPLQANVTNFDAQLGTKGATTDIKNAVYAAQAAAGVPGGTANSIAANTQLAHEMDAWGVDPGAMANAVGMSKDAIQALYNQVNPNGKYSTIPKTITNTITNTITGGGGGGGGGPQTSTILPTNPQTNAPAGTKNPYGNINNPGDLTYNPNGTTTVTPNVPGRPYGGFSGVGEVTNAYTAGGGSTGYTIPTYQNMDQFNAANNTLTGGSKAAYDYLMGKTPWNPLPTTPTGQVSVPYAQLMGQKLSPQYQVSTPQIYDPTTHTYITNPNYDPAFSATKDYLGVQQTGLTNPNALKVLGYTKLANGVMGYPNGDGTFTGADGKKYNADGTIFGSTTNSSSSSSSSSDGSLNNAKGGLLGLASGGMSVGHLGGYSDGGRLLRGPGDGVSDSIPATIGATDPEPARLADGEFVVPARIVSELGNGSTEAGARQLYKMMDRIQTARRKTTGKDAVATNTNAHKYLPA